MLKPRGGKEFVLPRNGKTASVSVCLYKHVYASVCVHTCMYVCECVILRTEGWSEMECRAMKEEGWLGGGDLLLFLF